MSRGKKHRVAKTFIVLAVLVPFIVFFGSMYLVSSNQMAYACSDLNQNSSTGTADIEIRKNDIYVSNQKLDPEQIENAGKIYAEGVRRKEPERIIVTSLQTAYQESGIRNLDYGDASGYGMSLGVFQETAYYGSKADRLNVDMAVKRFYDRVQAAPNYRELSPWDLVVKYVQRPDPAAYNSPSHRFSDWRPLAQALYDKFEGREIIISESSVIDYCQSSGSGRISLENGVAFPIQGNYDISSPYGNRWHPTKGGWSLHDGVDFAGMSEGTPVYSVLDGVVISEGLAGSYGNYVVVRLADGTEIGYAHLKFISVSKGDKIPAGTQIGGVGGRKGDPGAGSSTGVHLHFNVKLSNGEWTEPLTWLDNLQQRANAEAEESPEVLAGSSVAHIV